MVPLAGMIFASGIVILLGVVKVHQRHNVVSVGYELSEAASELHKLREENRRLRLEKSVLTHPARIERLARARGMRLPEPEQLRILSPPATETAAK